MANRVTGRCAGGRPSQRLQELLSAVTTTKPIRRRGVTRHQGRGFQLGRHLPPGGFGKRLFNLNAGISNVVQAAVAVF